MIYPVFVFGACDMLDQLTPVSDPTEKGTGLGNVMQSISRKMQGGLTLYYGRFYLPIPHTPQLSMVLGNPIHPTEGDATKNVHGDKLTCPRVDNPTDDQINELADRYVQALQRLFEQYKAEAGFENDILNVI